MTNTSFGAEQREERQKKTEELERSKRQNHAPAQAPEDRSRTRDLEDWKHKTAQQQEDRKKTDRIEELKRKRGS